MRPARPRLPATCERVLDALPADGSRRLAVAAIETAGASGALGWSALALLCTHGRAAVESDGGRTWARRLDAGRAGERRTA